MNNNIKKLALLGFTGAVIFAGQTNAGYNADELIAYRSWTCRTCQDDNHISSNDNGPVHSPEESVEEESAESSESETLQDNDESGSDSNGCGGRNGCGGATNASGTANEQRFVSQLTPENRRLYEKMDQSGRDLSLRLAKQYTDKNAALKAAFKQTNKEQIQQKLRADNQERKRFGLFN